MSGIDFTFTLDGEEHRITVGALQISALLAVLHVPAAGPVPAAPTPASAPSTEVGPVEIVGIEIATKNREGVALTSPKYSVKFGNGKTHATFDANTGQAAKMLWGQGKKVFYKTQSSRDGKYQNLAEIRSAEGQP
jgi:hypothetical protein